MPLASAGGAGRAADLVAGPQLAAADLGGADVDVALVGAEALEPQESIALRHSVEHAGDILGLDLGVVLAFPLALVIVRLLRGGLVIPIAIALPSPGTAAAATAPAAAASAPGLLALGRLVALGAGLVRLGVLGPARVVALGLLDRLDQLLAREHAETGHAELLRPPVKVG